MNFKSLKPGMCRITCVSLGLRSFGLLRSVFWWWLTDVSEQPIGSLFQGSWTAGNLKMGLVGCPESSVNSYQNTLPNDPEERTSQLHGGGSLNKILWKFSSYLTENTACSLQRPIS